MARTRSEQARSAVLAAGIDVLASEGVDGFTIDAVVVRSGVAKSTIYRWWPHRQALLLDVIHEQLVPAPTPNTGDARADLLTYLQRYLLEPIDTPASRLMPELCAAARRDPDLVELRDTLVRERRQPILTILELARARGDLAPGADLELLATLILGPLVYTYALRGRRVDVELATSSVDAALAFGANQPVTARRG